MGGESERHSDVSYEVDARLVQDAGAAGGEVDAAEHVLAGQRQGEERRRRWHAELVSCAYRSRAEIKLASLPVRVKFQPFIYQAVMTDALTHVVSDGFAVGEPPGGLAAGVVDAVPGVVGLGQGHGEVVVVPHVGHRVAEHVGHRTLVGGRRRARRRYGEVSRVCSSRIGRRRRHDG
jgi:hypothetical protein